MDLDFAPTQPKRGGITANTPVPRTAAAAPATAAAAAAAGHGLAATTKATAGPVRSQRPVASRGSGRGVTVVTPALRSAAAVRLIANPKPAPFMAAFERKALPPPPSLRTAPASQPKSSAAPAPFLVMETVAGIMSKDGVVDGPLGSCQFSRPFGLCRDGDALITCDATGQTVRVVDGVLGVVDPKGEAKRLNESGGVSVADAEFEARVVPAIMTAVPVLPKELARVMAHYACPRSGTRTIAGAAHVNGRTDGPALSGALFTYPQSVALDTSDPVAGPQLIIGESHRIRCLHMRSGTVTTIAGNENGWPNAVDGPAVSVAHVEAAPMVVYQCCGAVAGR
jgi:hypothetical protein